MIFLRLTHTLELKFLLTSIIIRQPVFIPEIEWLHLRIEAVLAIANLPGIIILPSSPGLPILAKPLPQVVHKSMVHIEGWIVGANPDHIHEAANPDMRKAVHRLESFIMAKSQVTKSITSGDPLNIFR
jgi:hypothetical protein